MTGAAEEIAADVAGQFFDEGFLTYAAKENYTLMDKIRGYLFDLLDTLGIRKYTDVEALKRTWDKALQTAQNQVKKQSNYAENSNVEGSKSSERQVKYSITEIKGKNGNYGIGVKLDTDKFSNKKPRNWNKVLTEFVYKNLAGQTLEIQDEKGNREKISFAKLNERIKKDGAKNSHKVIDKLARTKGNINTLSIVHIDELLETSKFTDSTDEHNHQWLDENGWVLRKAYVQDLNGNIYETTLNIAKARDGRNILYALSNTKKVDDGDVSSASNEEGLAHKHQLSKGSVPQQKQKVKPQNKKSVGEINPYDDSSKIKKGMSDEKRADILTKKEIKIAHINRDKAEVLAQFDLETLNNTYTKRAIPILKKITEQFGITQKSYINKDIELEFGYSNNSLRESIQKQKKSYKDFAKMFSVFDDVINNAVGIEVHDDKYKGTSREDTSLENMYVLVSAFDDGDSVVPVKLEVKEYADRANKLYVTVTVDRKRNQGPKVSLDNDYQLHNSHLISSISISDILRSVKETEGDFLKYFPDSMLSTEQVQAKKTALENDKVRIEEYKKKNSNKQSVGPINPFEQAQADLEYLNSTYGVIEPGENAVRDVRIPKKNEGGTYNSRFSRTAAESAAFTDEQAAGILEAVKDGTFSYTRMTDKKARELAEVRLKKRSRTGLQCKQP